MTNRPFTKWTLVDSSQPYQGLVSWPDGSFLAWNSQVLRYFTGHTGSPEYWKVPEGTYGGIPSGHSGVFALKGKRLLFIDEAMSDLLESEVWETIFDRDGLVSKECRSLDQERLAQFVPASPIPPKGFPAPYRSTPFQFRNHWVGFRADGRVDLWDGNLTYRRTLRFPGKLAQVRPAADRGLVFLSQEGICFWPWNEYAGYREDWEDHQAPIDGCLPLPKGEHLSWSEEGRMVVWSPFGTRLASWIAHPEPLWQVGILDDREIVAISDHGTCSRFDLAGNTLAESFTTEDLGQAVLGLLGVDCDSPAVAKARLRMGANLDPHDWPHWLRDTDPTPLFVSRSINKDDDSPFQAVRMVSREDYLRLFPRMSRRSLHKAGY